MDADAGSAPIFYEGCRITGGQSKESATILQAEARKSAHSNSATKKYRLIEPCDHEGTFENGECWACGWKAGNYYVTYELDPGEILSVELIENGGKAQRPEDPARSWAIFQGWYQVLADGTLAAEPYGFDVTSSCCPAFVQYIKSAFPDLLPLVSHNLSPMVALAEYIKRTDKTAKVVFIGPCTAKKAEMQLEKAKPYVDVVMTFEELQALFDGKDVDITTMEEGVLDNASYFGRIFARSGGLSDAVAQAMKEQNIDFPLKAVACDGIEECRMALLKKSKNVLDANFIEGMACIGGCIGGAGCLTHGEKNKAEVDKYGREALEKTISDAVAVLK